MDKITKSFRNLLEKNHILSLATKSAKDGRPYINNVFYYSDTDFNLYFISGQNTEHAQNITQDKHVAITIYDSVKKPEVFRRGAQIFGVCNPASIEDYLKIAKEFVTKFPNTKLTKDMLNEMSNSRVYKVTVEKILYLDEHEAKGTREIPLNMV